VGFANASVGTNVVPVVAIDYSGNVRSNRYQIVVTSNGIATTQKYDLNGNLTNLTTTTYTNTYEWYAADRLAAVNGPTNRSEFTYDGWVGG
jgi:YD repeat-containing protein